MKEKERAASVDGRLDPLLVALCGNPDLKCLPAYMWPVSCRGFNGKLREQDVYRLGTDFPLLGKRLWAIEEFNLRQSPSRVRDLWRDRRIPIQWYTFWAVLIIGGASLLLTLVQTAVAIGALIVQMKESKEIVTVTHK